MDYIVLIDLGTGAVEKLVKTPRTHPRTHAWTHPNPSWSPDGSMVMYDSDESGVSQIYIVVIDEQKVRARFGDAAIASGS
jgi:Tol biopolymer transport system component